MVTNFGQCIRFRETDARATGGSSMGVRGIHLMDEDEVVSMVLADEAQYLLIVSEKGMGKLTPVSEFRLQGRGGKGILCYRILEKTGNLIGALAVEKDDEIMMINTDGIIIRMSCETISVLSRITSGVQVKKRPNLRYRRRPRYSRDRRAELSGDGQHDPCPGDCRREAMGEHWAVGSEDLATGEVCGYQDADVMQSASVVKLFIMGAVYRYMCYPPEGEEPIPFGEEYEGHLSEII